jgi:hypothetical protein
MWPDEWRLKLEISPSIHTPENRLSKMPRISRVISLTL